MRKKRGVVVRLWGGLGNQLFLYAAARRLALANGVQLKLDIHSGFKRDYVYRRKFMLHHFNIAGGFATPAECWETPIGRIRRFLWRRCGHHLPLEWRALITDDVPDCRAHILTLHLTRRIYLEGYWQDEDYFKDIGETLRCDLQITSPHSFENVRIAHRIEKENSVCVHARVLPAANTPDAKPDHSKQSLSLEYYRQAVDFIAQHIEKPHFFCFSDYPGWLQENLEINHPTTFVCHNRGDDRSYEDFWLMSQCKHFIIANSTFSWWAAWLGQHKGKRVLAPDMRKWGLPELIRPFEVIDAD